MTMRKGGKNIIGLTSSTPAVSPMQAGTSRDANEFFGDRRAHAAASPIDRADHETRLFQTITEGNQTDLAFTGDINDHHKKKHPSAPYPFPRPECMDDVLPVNRYDCLVDTLDILKHYITLPEKMKGKASEGPLAAAARPQKKLAPKNPRQQPKKDFKFTSDMFKSNNSEAFIQVTHFLFETLDKSQCAARFRECWPIYEKKQEGLYRRAALEWFKELVTENPKWFSKYVKVEQLQGLVVNPYGDRFIRFIHSFADFVMYNVTKSGPLLEVPLMEKPVFTGKPEVTYRQAATINARLDDLVDFTIEEEKKRLHELMKNKEVEKRMKRKEAAVDRQLAEDTKTVRKLIKKRPDLFPENAEELLDNEKVFFKNAFRDIPYASRWQAMDFVQSPLYEHVHNRLIEKSQEVDEKMDQALDFIRNNSRFFTLVQAAYQEPVELDLATLFIPEQLKNKTVDLDELLEAYGTLVEDCLHKVNQVQVSEDLIRRKEMLDIKIQLLKQKLQNVEKIPSDDPEKLRREVDFETQKLEIELEDVDWSVLSGLNDPPLAAMFDFSPTRTVDATRQTGLTPAISSYLPALDFSKTLDQASQSLNDTKFSVKKEAQATSSAASTSSSFRVKVQPSSSRPVVKEEPLGGSSVPDQSVCDSPISHLPPSLPKNRFQEITGSGAVQLRNIRRSNGSNPKFRLSLPVVTDEENVASSNDGTPDATVLPNPRQQQRNEDSSPEFVGLTEASEQRISALLQSLADATADSPEQPAVVARNRRRSSQNFRRDRNSLDLTALNQSSMEDLENKLGIMDVNISYATLLDLSMEDDDFETNES